MIKSFKTGSLCFFVALIVFISAPKLSEAFSLSPVSVIRQTVDAVAERLSDIIYYLVMQKKYMFDDYTDPNIYPALNIPANVDKITASSVIQTPNDTADGDLITITGRTLPGVNTAVPANVSYNANHPTSILIAEKELVTSAAPNKSDLIDSSRILSYTNIERIAKSLKPLTQDSVLDAIALARADDLFTNQYFEHESPDGKSASDVAKQLGYDYLLIGENLALGDFGSDQGIVTAWMNSPGHRANILNDKYDELGVAVKTGFFKGERNTIAVQIFARPLADCPQPSRSTKALIDSSTASIQQMQAEAAIMYNDLITAKNNPATDHAYYNQKVQEYNYFVRKVNAAIAVMKEMIGSYNIEVSKYNTCVSS